MADYLNKFDIKPVYADQGAAGWTHTKTTEMRVSAAGTHHAQRELGTLRVNGFQTNQSPALSIQMGIMAKLLTSSAILQTFLAALLASYYSQPTC